MIPKPNRHITFCLLLLLSAGGLPDTTRAMSMADNPHVLFGWQWRAAAGTAGDMPFWLHSNRMGRIDRYSANTTLNLSGSWQWTHESGLRFSTATNVLFRGSEDAVIRLQEGYIQAAYGHYVLGAGRKREYFGLVHPELSMGTMDHSANIRPMPKIYFATDGFQFIPGTRRVFYYDAGLAHGWMDDARYRFVDDVLMHQKHLYLRMFTEDAPVVPRAGIVHFAHWGGISPIHGEAPVNLRSYRDVFFALAADSKEILGGGALLNNHQNHFGSYDFALMLNLGRYRMAISRQFILEDTPNARFGTPWDGMWGAYIELRDDSQTRWRETTASGDRRSGSSGRKGGRSSGRGSEHRPLVKAIHYEHINTLDGLTRYPQRDDRLHVNYYNHSAYRGGWTYFGRVAGNPLYFGDPDFFGVVNNILVGHHVGVMGYAGPVDWRFFTTYSRNYGAGQITVRETGNVILGLTDRRDQWSMMLELETDLFSRSGSSGGPATSASTATSATSGSGPAGSGFGRTRSALGSWLAPMRLAVTLGYDTGEVYPDNFGVMIGLRWQGSGL